jgi:hypothetical protein
MDSDRYAHCNLPMDRKYNVDRQLWKIMDAVDDAIDFFWDIKLLLDLGEEWDKIIRYIDPPFDPFKTIGKYR